MPNSWVCNSILYSLLLFSLSRSLLHCLDQLICFFSCVFDISLLASSGAECNAANCILAQHTHGFVYSLCTFVLQSTHLHAVLLLYVCSSVYTSACCTFTVCLFFSLNICMLYCYCMSVLQSTHLHAVLSLYVCSSVCTSACRTCTVSFRLYLFSFCHALIQRLLVQRTFLVGLIRLCVFWSGV